MPALGVAYDPRNFNPDSQPEPFPGGRYRFMVMSSEPKPANGAIAQHNGTYDRSYLKVEHEVQGGPSNGRKFWNQFTLTNPNPEAVRIGGDQLAAFCQSVGWWQPLTNSDDLHGRSGEADIEIEPAGRDPKTGKDFPAKNVVKKYIAPGGAAIKSGAVAPASEASPQQNDASSVRMVKDSKTGQMREAKPWEK